MQAGVFAKTFDGDNPDTVMAASQAAGFAAIQYNMACSGLGSLPLGIPHDTAVQIHDAAVRSGLQIAAISATYNMTDPDPDRQARGRAAFHAIAGAAQTMASPMLSVCSGSMDPHDKWRRHPDNDLPESWIMMCREFEGLCDCAVQHGLLIGVEPEYANIVSDAEKAARLLAEFPGGPIRIILDPANILENVPLDQHQGTLARALDVLGDHIGLAHAKDRYEDGRVAPAGKGIVDWPYFLSGLADAGYDGQLIAHGMTADEAPAVARFLTQQIERI